MSSRDKAKLFAMNLPKPKPKKEGLSTNKSGKDLLFMGSPAKKEYDKLESNHAMYFDEVQKMKKQYLLDFAK